MKASSRIALNLTPGRVALASLPLVLAAVALNTSSPAGAVEAPAPRPAFERVQFADVIAEVQPAVVKISVTKTIGGVARLGGQAAPFDGGPFGEFLRRFGPFSFVPQGEPETKAEGLGSGFIIDADGYVVTNNHVIDGADVIGITLNDGREFDAELVGNDPLTDLALLKIKDGKNLPHLEFGDSDAARVGDWVVAIGSPFGFGGSATAGIISARGRDIHSGPYDDYLQIDAPINSGNSGGPIVDASGRVIGVNTAIFSPNGGNIGIGFAIPAQDAQRIVAELKDKGSVTRGWLGVQIQGVNPDVAEALNLNKPTGALVASVVPKSPAALAGVQPGDVILRFNETDITEPRDLSRVVASTEPGSKVSIEVMRRGEERRLAAVIDRNAEAQKLAYAAHGDEQANPDDLGLGLALGPVPPEAREQLDLGPDVQGAFVVGVKNNGPAAESGVRPGDVIVQVNQKNVKDVDDASRELAEAKAADRPIMVLVRRGEDQFFTTFKPA
ncbi:MAG: DegQ family serine endoprotease [Gammaproteobacteria bacterium]|nr:DegQ family serine endoprotease [Gammaproteobacteria bacterium]MCP5198766.1 DegQ family serine endoprotease [Gammaproteobacteria bacterium]